jgi:hypothetical protein
MVWGLDADRITAKFTGVTDSNPLEVVALNATVGPSLSWIVYVCTVLAPNVPFTGPDNVT